MSAGATNEELASELERLLSGFSATLGVAAGVFGGHPGAGNGNTGIVPAANAGALPVGVRRGRARRGRGRGAANAAATGAGSGGSSAEMGGTSGSGSAGDDV